MTPTEDLELQLLDHPPPNFSIYDPFQVPPDLFQSLDHGKAKRVKRNVKMEMSNLCPCCSLSIDGQEISLGCNLRELGFLGCAYPFYFYFMKEVVGLMLMIAILGGSWMIFMNNRHCDEKCVTFLGIAIHNPNFSSQIFLNQSWMDTILSILMIVYIVWCKSRCFAAMKYYNDSAVSPCSYTIMVQNLARNTNEKEIKDFFENVTKSTIAKINFAYDISEYKTDFKRKLEICSNLKQLELQLTELEAKDKLSQDDKMKKLESITNRINDLLKDKLMLEEKLHYFMENCDSNKDKFTGTVFISFDSQHALKVLLDNWGVTWLKNLKFLLFGKWLNPYLQFGSNTLLIHAAPDPSDLIWENLHFSFFKDLFNNLLMFFCAFFILVLSFQIQFGVVEFVTKLKSDTDATLEKGSFLIRLSALLLSSMILFSNFLLKLMVFYFSKAQRLYSFTKLNESFVNIYVWLSFFNSALMPYLIHYRLSVSRTPELLIWDIHFILLTNAFSTPICKVFDPFLFYRYFKQKQIYSKGKKNTLTQLEANKWFEGHPFDTAENYAYVARSLLIGCWFASMAPLGLIFALMGIGCNYWLDKYFLLKVNSLPVNQNEGVIYKIVNNLEILPYLYIYGAIVYQHQVIISQNLIDFTWKFLFYGITSVSLTFLLIIYYIFFKYKIPSKNVNDLKHDDAKFLFLNDYDRINPVTAIKASRDFIKAIKETENLSPLEKQKLIRRTKSRGGRGFVNVVNMVQKQRESIKKRETMIEEELKEKVFELKRHMTL